MAEIEGDGGVRACEGEGDYLFFTLTLTVTPNVFEAAVFNGKNPRSWLSTPCVLLTAVR